MSSTTETEEGMILLGIAEFGEAKRIQYCLEERGVGVRLRSDPETCGTGGCKPKVELWGLSKDVEAVRKFFLEEKTRALEGLEFDPALEEAVFDPDAAEALCPACGTKFPTSLKECPDCGLVFVTGDEE